MYVYIHKSFYLFIYLLRHLVISGLPSIRISISINLPQDNYFDRNLATFNWTLNLVLFTTV